MEQFLNRTWATLATGIDAVTTSLPLTTGHGARFGTIAAGNHIRVDMLDASLNVSETIYITAITGDNATIERGKDGTTATTHLAGDRIEARIGKSTFELLAEKVGNSSQPFLVGTATEPGHALRLDQSHGILIGCQIFTASGSYAKGTNNPNYVIVEVVGGGGGGSSNTNSWSGSGGGYGRAKFLASALAASETITVGAGGTGGAAGGGNGGNGGSSTFGTTPASVGMTVSGGNGGTSGYPGAGSGGAVTVLNGHVANSNISIRGGGGSYAGSSGTGSKGGGCPLGNSGSGSVTSTAAEAGQGYGAGGGSIGLVGASNVGGAGAPGIVIVWEYK